MAKVLSLPGSQAVEELRLLITADLFIMTDDVASEKVTNGIVTNAVSAWISDADHLRQVELLPWIAKELSGWDYFAPQPRGTTEPRQVRCASRCGRDPQRVFRTDQVLGLQLRAQALPLVEEVRGIHVRDRCIGLVHYGGALQVLEALAAAHKTILTWEMHETAQEWQRQSTNGHSHNGADIAEAASKVQTCLVQAHTSSH